MKKSLILVSIVALVMVISGCATLFGSSSEDVSMTSNPPSADVYVNGNYMGKTPLTLSLAKDKDYTVQFRKEGYEIRTEIINSSLGVKWLVLDILGGFVPIIVDAVTGDWMELDTDSVNVMLAPNL